MTIKKWDAAKCVHGIVSKGLKFAMAAGVSWRHAEADPVVEVRRCLVCGVLMPLPDDTLVELTPQVSIEIRAAEIAHHPIDDLDNLNCSFEESLGHVESAEDIDDYLSWYTDATWAGWLAYKIHAHDDIEKEAHEDPDPV